MDSYVRRFGVRGPAIKRPYVLDTRFFIPYKHFMLVWDVTKEWHKFSVSKSGKPSHRIVSLFNRAIDFGVGITREVGDKEDKGDIVALWHKYDVPLKQDDHWRFFQLIAKYVREGSYINLMKSDRRKYTDLELKDVEPLEENIRYVQWYFNGDCMIEKQGKLVFEK